MSRTLKDRPHWVKVNDKNVARTEYHNHERAGEPVYRSRIAKDENGNNVMESYTIYGVIGYGHYYGVSYYTDWSLYATWNEFYEAHHKSERFKNDRKAYAKYGDVEKTRPKYETVLIGYRPTECTIDKPVGRRNHWFDGDTTHLCEQELARWTTPACSCCHPDTRYAKSFHRGSRANEKAALRKLAKEAYAGYEYEDDTYEDVLNMRKKIRRGIGW